MKTVKEAQINQIEMAKKIIAKRVKMQRVGLLDVKPQIISGDFRGLFQVETPVTFCG